MELWQYYRILRKRRWLILIGTFICVGIVAISLRMGSDRFIASTTIMEKMSGDDRVVIYAGGYSYQVDPALRLANLAQLVQSRTVKERASATLSGLKDISDPGALLSSMGVFPVLDTSILRITVSSESEEEAKAAADIVAKEFIAYYNEMNYGGAMRSKQFIESETPKALARLNAIREEMRKYKEKSGMVQLDNQTALLLQQVNILNQRAQDAQITAKQAEAKIQHIERQMKDFPETRTMGRVIATNPVWQSIQTDLIKQQIELERMLRKRTEEHPEVKALRKQLEETKRQLAAQTETMVNSTNEQVNPIRENLVQNYIAAVTERAASYASCTATEQEIGALKPKLESLPVDEMRLAQLQMEEDAAKNTYSLLRQKRDEAIIKVKEAEDISSIRVVDPARTEPADTRKKLKLILAIILSPIFCSGVALLLNYLDNSVKTPAEAEALLKLPVFAVVPIARSHSLLEKKCLPVIDTSFQMLSTNLWLGNEELESNTVLVASAEPDVGRSTTAANLAVTLARDGARVILVDSDLRRPSQHQIFKLDNETGLSNVLAGKLALKDALKPTSITDLLVLTSGPLPANPMRLFRSPEMQRLVEDISRLADYVVFDSPAGITFADGTLLAGLVKNVVVVYAAGTVPRGAETEFVKKLGLVNANVLGVVLNMVNPEDSHGFYHLRVGYEEMLRNGKGPAAMAERMLRAIPDDAGDKTEEKTGAE